MSGGSLPFVIYRFLSELLLPLKTWVQGITGSKASWVRKMPWRRGLAHRWLKQPRDSRLVPCMLGSTDQMHAEGSMWDIYIYCIYDLCHSLLSSSCFGDSVKSANIPSYPLRVTCQGHGDKNDRFIEKGWHLWRWSVTSRIHVSLRKSGVGRGHGLWGCIGSLSVPTRLITNSRALGKPFNLWELVSFVGKMKMTALRWFPEP